MATYTKDILLFWAGDGSGITGVTPADIDVTVTDSDGDDLITAQPATTELGRGWYKLSVPDVDTTKQYVITGDLGATYDNGWRYSYGTIEHDTLSALVAAELATYDAPTKAEMDIAHALLAVKATCTEGRLSELDPANLPADIAAIPDAVADEEYDNDGTAISLRGAVKLFLSLLTGKSSGGGTSTHTYRDIADTKDRISATVTSVGDRTSIGTRDAT